MSRVAIIPARGGSRRIPGKNVRPFHGRPIIEYSIETAARSGLFDAGIWVSTEDAEIARIAWAAGAKVHPRQKALAENDVGTQDVMAAVLKELWPIDDLGRPATACCIYPCAPLMLPGDLVAGWQRLVRSKDLGYVYSVDQDGHDAGQWYWGLTSAFLNHVPLVGPHVWLERIPKERVCDVNTFEDWERAHHLYATMKEKR
jgi:N-acylneuraminate cytidylyltransferase